MHRAGGGADGGRGGRSSLLSVLCKTVQQLLDAAQLSDNGAKGAQLAEDVTVQLATSVAERKVRRQLNAETGIGLIDTDEEDVDVDADPADTVCDLVEPLVHGHLRQALRCQSRQLLDQAEDVDNCEEDQVLALSMLTELVCHVCDQAKQKKTCGAHGGGLAEAAGRKQLQRVFGAAAAVGELRAGHVRS